MEDVFYRLNPWWEGGSWEAKDYDLARWSQQRVRWVPKWIGEIPLEPYSLSFVLGPRQVGKTTGLKLLAKRLVEEGRSPVSIFYYNCDFLASPKDLVDVLKTYGRIRRSAGVASSVIILDEITSAPYWWRALKGLVDAGYFARDVVIATGSSTAKAERYAEAFPGRRGLGRDVAVLPLDFPTYVEVLGVEAERREAEALYAAFDKYLETGGYPRPINGGADPAEYVAAVEREVAKLGRSVEIFRQVVKALLEKAPSALSYHAVAHDIGLSHTTVREYVELARDLYIVHVIYRAGPAGPDFKKEKKVMFRDPFVAKALAAAYGARLGEEAILEWVVQEHLLRKFGEVYYGGDDGEVDALAGPLRIEVKKGRRERRRGVAVLSKYDIPLFLIELFRKQAP